MPDVSMCSGTGCARALERYRHTAKPTPHWQAWFATPPVKPDGTCAYFWPTSTEARP